MKVLDIDYVVKEIQSQVMLGEDIWCKRDKMRGAKEVNCWSRQQPR